MGTRYQKRAAGQIRKRLTELLQTKINDPRVQMVTITGVEVTPDVSWAHVYFSVMGGAEAQAEALEGLQSAAGYLRRELGQRIRLRNTPKLVFHWDPSYEHGERIDSLLDQLWDDEPESSGSE